MSLQQSPEMKTSIKTAEPFIIPKWAPVAIILFTAILYCNAIFNGFVSNWDDKYYILQNTDIKSLSLKNLITIFTSFYQGLYEPLTMLTYMVEYVLFKLNPLPYHLINILIHLANTWLVYKLTERLSGKKIAALAVMLLFAVHPMHVESVAWISERKDVLYSLFFLFSLLSYLRFIQSGFRAKYYVITLLLFLASLLSKSAAVTLPVLLIVIDLYKGRKLNLRLLTEKIPFFLLSFAAGIITMLSQKQAGAMADLVISYSFIDKLFFITYSILFYLVKLVIPFNLSAMHYYPDISSGTLPWQYYASLPFVLLIVWLMIRRNTIRKEIVFGFIFFLITISVMLPIISVGSSIASERYTYVPYIGLFFIAGQWISELKRKQLKNIVLVLFLLVALVFSFLTWKRIAIWKNGITLFTDVIKKNPGMYHGYWMRALEKTEKGDLQGALQDYNQALECKPDHIICLQNRAAIRINLNDFAGAVQDMNYLISLDSSVAKAYNNRGNALDGLGDSKAALRDYNKAISLDPGNAEAYNNRSVLKITANDLTGALLDIDQAIKLSPDNADLYCTRGFIKAGQKDYAASFKDYNYSLELKPDNMKVYFYRGMASLGINDTAGACGDWVKASNAGISGAEAMIKLYCK
jgi:protein O-mannosyl-transferase